MTRLGMPEWFSSFATRYRRSVVIALALGIVGSACASLLMFTSGYLISATSVVGISLFSVMAPVACVQLFGIGRPFARYLERLVSHDWVLKVTSDLRRMLFDGIRARFGDPARARAAGEYLSLLSDDIAHLQNLYLRVVFPTVVAGVTALLASVLFAAFSPGFGLLMLLSLACISTMLPLATLGLTRARAAALKQDSAQRTIALSDDIAGAWDWVLSGRAGEAIDSHTARDAKMRRGGLGIRLTQRAFATFASILLGLLACAVIAWAAGRFGSAGADANWIAAFALGFLPLIETLAALPSAASLVPVYEDSLLRLDEYLACADNPDDGPSANIGASPDLVIEGLSYTYPGTSSPALANVNLFVPFGQKLVLLGRSGAGKSTLAQAIRATLPGIKGTITLGDQAIGKGASCAKAIGYLGQSPYLFNRSIRENLLMGTVQCDDARLEDVLESVGLDTRMARMPHGLDTVIGETGVGLSGGEAHRLALARILLRDPRVVLVDEPFAALDPQTESELLDTLFNACEGRTLIVITHHLAQVERFDRVVFLEDGRIDLDGSPAKLTAESTRFATLLAFEQGNPPNPLNT